MLNSVFGTAGTGKTFFVQELMRNNMALKKKSVFLVPEQFSMFTEKQLIEVLGVSSQRYVEVMSFSKLCTEVLSETGPFRIKYLDKSGKIMLAQKVLQQHRKKLSVFSKQCFNHGFAAMFVEMAEELKRYRITVTDFKKIVGYVPSCKFKEKLSDISMLLSQYNNYFAGELNDGVDNLSLTASKLSSCKRFDNNHVYIDGFKSFTAAEYAVLTELIKKTDVTIVLLSDNLSRAGDDDFFAVPNATYAKLCKIAKDNSIEIASNVHLTDEIRFNANESLLYLKRYFFDFSSEKFKTNPTNIKLCHPQNYYEEIKAVAEEIVKLANTGNRFQDISVVFSDIKNYKDIISIVFAEYKINYFLDKKKSIALNPLIGCMLSVMQIWAYGFSYERVMDILRSGFLPIKNKKIDMFENYILKINLSHAAWHSSADWHYNDNEKKIDIDAINVCRKILLDPIIGIKKNINEKKTYSTICDGLIAYLRHIDAKTHLQNRINKFVKLGKLDIAEEYRQVWDLFLEFLCQIKYVFRQQRISYENFLNIFTAACEEISVTSIPPAIDQVIISDAANFRNHSFKFLMLIGVNQGVFPKSFKNEGLISDEEREELKTQGLEIAPTCKQRQIDEQFLIYNILTAPSEKLYIFSPLTEQKGNQLKPSFIVNRIKAMFPQIVIEYPKPSDFLFFSQVTDKDFEFSDVKNDKLSNDIAEKLYGTPLYISVSKLEKYNACEFAFFMKYGLLAQPRQLAEFAPKTIGLFLHEVLAEYFKTLKNKEANYSLISKDQCKCDIEKLIERIAAKWDLQYYVFSNYFNYLMERIKCIATVNAWATIKFYSRSKFRPLGMEISFKDGGDYQPCIVEVGNKKVFLTGVVDRVDVCDIANNKYISVVDYKLYEKKMNLNLMELGIQIQTIVYAEMLRNAENFKLAAVLYSNMDDPIIQLENEVENEQLEDDVLKACKMNGWVLDDEKLQIGSALDSGFKTSGICAIPSFKSTKNLLSTEEINERIAKVKLKTKNSVQRILDGFLDIKPVINKYYNACEYCEYYSICNKEAAR